MDEEKLQTETPQPMKAFFQRLPLICTILLIALLQGCETGPITEPPEDGKPPSKTADGRDLTEIEQLLLQAESAAPLEKSEYTLQAAEQLFGENNFDRSQLLLESINPLMLSINREQQYWLLRARIAHEQLNPQKSLEWIARITQPDTLPADLRQILADLEIANQNLLGNNQAALDTLIERSALADGEQRSAINSDIWNLLKGVSDQDLQALLSNPDNSYLQQGWYELAQTTRTKGTDILQSSQALSGWQQLWNLHPAATHLPHELQLILSQQAKPLSHIAILLPQSGKLAKPAAAIIEGILAAQFQDQRLGRATPKLSFYDSAQIDDIQQFYLSVDPLQYDLVIGPLSKSKLAGLTNQTNVPIATLALNYRQDDGNTENLFQFGLRGEDEAVQVAQKAWQQGHRRALSLTSSASWGQRVHTAFADEWLRLGGEVISHQSFTGDGDFSDRISQLLAVDQSQQRYNELRRYVGEKMEFETRRRKDVDFVFLSALAKDARQIKPTLAFHYASRLPVYATSHVFSGVQSAVTDQDLNGILFCDIPWILQTENPLRAELELHRQNTQTRFGKLYALGSDAYRVSAYLEQLKTASGSHLQGQTGRLTVDNQGRVARNLDWAIFKNGIPQPED